MATPSIEITLDIDGKKTTALITKGAVKAGTVAGERTGEAFSEKFASNAKKGIKAGSKGISLALDGVKKAAAVAAGALGVLGVATVFSSKQEDAIRNLEVSLQRIGEFSKETSTEIQNFASSLQSVTTAGDEVILQQLAIAQSFGATAEQSKELVKAALDLSAAQGKGLDESVRQLSKSLGGFAGELGEVIPEIKDLTSEQLKNGAAIKIIGDQYKGFATQQAQTFSGAIIGLKNNIGDFFEAIGATITQSKTFRAVIIAVGQGVAIASEFLKGSAGGLGDLFASSLSAFAEQLQIIFNGLRILGKQIANNSGVQLFAKQIGTAAEGVNILGTTLKTLAKVGQIAFGSLQTGLLSITNGITASLSAFGLISDETAKAVRVALTESANETKASLNELFSGETISRAESFTESLRATFQDLTGGQLGDEEGEGPLDGLFDVLSLENIENIKSRFSELSESVKSELSGLSSTTQKETNKIAQALENGLVNTLATSFAFLGKSLAGAGEGFKAFLGLVLNALGDLAISIGTTVVAASQAILGLRAMLADFGISGLVFGAALIAVGGALKAFSSSFGGGSSNPVGTSSGGGNFTSQPNKPVSDSLDFADTEERQQSKVNQLIVNGDVFDSEETGSRIVELLNNTFGDEATSLANARFA